jgi:hypothetical protein
MGILKHAMTGAGRQARYAAKKRAAQLEIARHSYLSTAERQPIKASIATPLFRLTPTNSREYDRRLLEELLSLPKDERPAF